MALKRATSLEEGLEQTVCSMLLANFNAGDKLIFGVEQAVNSFGVSTPSEVSAEFRFTQTLGSVLPSKRIKTVHEFVYTCVALAHSDVHIATYTQTNLGLRVRYLEIT